MAKQENIQYYPAPVRSDQMDLREVIQIVWRHKWIVIGVTFLFAVGSVVWALSLPNIYEAEAKLAPTEEAQGAFSNMGGQLGGLASLAGVNLQGGKTDNATMALEILRSRKFLTDFVQRRDILPELMATKSWSLQTGEVTYDDEMYDPATETWLAEGEPQENAKPSNWDAVRRFREILKIERDDISGIVTVRLEHQSPVLAKDWINWLIEDLNSEMRQRDVAEASKSISYLENEMEDVNLASMRQVFYQLMEQQMQTIMLANVRPEYVFRVLDPAVVAEQRAKPMRSVIAVVGTMLGGFLSLLIVFFINLFKTPVARDSAES